jgi:hypothetical protein
MVSFQLQIRNPLAGPQKQNGDFIENSVYDFTIGTCSSIDG